LHGVSFVCKSFPSIRRTPHIFVFCNPQCGDFRRDFVQNFLPLGAVAGRMHKNGAIRIIVLNSAELSLFEAPLSTKLSTPLLKT